jgi:hypothetical protein
LQCRAVERISHRETAPARAFSHPMPSLGYTPAARKRPMAHPVTQQ